MGGRLLPFACKGTKKSPAKTTCRSGISTPNTNTALSESEASQMGGYRGRSAGWGQSQQALPPASAFSCWGVPRSPLGRGGGGPPAALPSLPMFGGSWRGAQACLKEWGSSPTRLRGKLTSTCIAFCLWLVIWFKLGSVTFLCVWVSAKKKTQGSVINNENAFWLPTASPLTRGCDDGLHQFPGVFRDGGWLPFGVFSPSSALISEGCLRPPFSAGTCAPLSLRTL